MDKVVVDASVAVKWFVKEANDVDALRLLNEYHAGRLLFLAPDTTHAEVGNIAWKKQRFQGMPVPAAQRINADFGALTFTLTSSALLADDALRLAIAHGRSVYDCLYVALSVRESCRFVTAGDKLANALARAFPNIVRLANWP